MTGLLYTPFDSPQWVSFSEHVAGGAGLIRKHRGRLILSRECRQLLGGDGMAAIYPRLLRAHAQRYNWGYADGYPDLPFIQQSFLFTLYLLQPSTKTPTCGRSPRCWMKSSHDLIHPRKARSGTATPSARSCASSGW